MMIDPLLGPKTSRKGLGLLALAGTITAIAATLYQSAQLNADLAFSDPAWSAWCASTVSVSFFSPADFGHLGPVHLASLEYFDKQSMKGGEYYG